MQSVSHPAICSEKEWLHHRYRITVADYQRAFALVNARIGILKQSDYEGLRTYIDEARETAERRARHLTGISLSMGAEAKMLQLG